MPTIVFKMKMEPDIKSYPVPSDKDTTTFAAEVASQRTSWLTAYLDSNYELKDDATFTLTGDAAVYMRDLINGGSVTFVEIISSAA